MKKDRGQPTATADQQRLRELAAILEHSDSAILSLDLDGRITSWNLGAEKLYGYPADEAIGCDFSMLLPERRAGEIRKALDKIRRGRQLRATESEHLRKDRSLLAVSFVIYPLRDDSGELVGACTVTSDISRKKRAERALQESSAQVQAVVDTVLDGIVTINEYGIIDSFNPAAERLFGYRAHEVIGLNVNVLMPEPYHSRHDGYLRNYQQTGEAKIIGIGREVQAQRKDGSQFPIDLAVAEMRVGDRRGFVGIIHDISERKETECALHGLNADLEGKVAELGAALAELQRTQELLVESEKMASLGELVAGVAHEINNPLGICITASSILHSAVTDLQRKRSEGGIADAELEGFLSRLDQSSHMILNNLTRAAELVNSFKQTAVDRSSSQLREFNLHELIHDLLSSLHPLLRKHPHEVAVDCDEALTLKNYPGALSQVLTNLIKNSLMHAYREGDNGHIRIEAKRREQTLDLVYRDDGCGIAPEHLKHIFEPFFTTARNRGGTGIGLNVTYNLVSQALGGVITVDSEPGRGTRFHIRIPLQLSVQYEP